MSRLLPQSFEVEKYQACLPFIVDAEFSLGPSPAACCHFNSTAFTPELATQFGLILPQTLQHAVKKRQAEYIASRWLVAKLMESINIPDFQLYNRSDRSPIWPDNTVGSLSHHGNKVFVILDTTPAWVGNDIEKMLTADKAIELSSMVMNAKELAILTKAGLTLSQATTLVFSAKESLYKAVYPDVQTVFGFEQVTVIEINPELGLLTVQLSTIAQPIRGINPRWQIHYHLTETEVMSWLRKQKS